MAPFKQYSRVRICRLRRTADDAYDDWRVNGRRPRPGDVGTIVEVLHAPAAGERYVVECVAPDGQTEWLCDLTADEIEPIDG